MEASHTKHRPHIKEGNYAEEEEDDSEFIMRSKPVIDSGKISWEDFWKRYDGRRISRSSYKLIDGSFTRAYLEYHHLHYAVLCAPHVVTLFHHLLQTREWQHSLLHRQDRHHVARECGVHGDSDKEQCRGDNATSRCLGRRDTCDRKTFDDND